VSDTVSGSCLCGAIRFEVELPFTSAGHCHCRRCQKHSGAPHTTSARTSPERIRFIAGEELLRGYRPAPGAGNKMFCSECGASLFGGAWPEGPVVSVRLSALDDEPQIRPQTRQYVAYNAPWYEIPDDGLPRFDEASPTR
jgi:hypothetical protein